MSTMELAELYEKALALEPATRWTFAERLLTSVPMESQPEIERFWRSEVRQRLEELRSGIVTCIPWEDAMAQMEQIIVE